MPWALVKVLWLVTIGAQAEPQAQAQTQTQAKAQAQASGKGALAGGEGSLAIGEDALVTIGTQAKAQAQAHAHILSYNGEFRPFVRRIFEANYFASPRSGPYLDPRVHEPRSAPSV